MSKFDGEATQIEDNRNKIGAITGNETDPNLYPNVLAVLEIINTLDETFENYIPVTDKVQDISKVLEELKPKLIPSCAAVIDYVKGQVPSIDTDLSETSENPVQNKVITSHINMLDNTVRRKVDASQISNDVTETSIYIRIPTNEAVRNYVAAEIAKIAVYNGESEDL